MDEQQNEAAKQYDQRMFAWVNHRQLPLQSTSPGLLDLITDLFGNKSHDANKKLWDPNRPAKRFRLLVKGSARMGEEQITTEDENEFDFGSSRVCSRNVRIVAASFRDNIIPRGTNRSYLRSVMKQTQQLQTLSLISEPRLLRRLLNSLFMITGRQRNGYTLIRIFFRDR